MLWWFDLLALLNHHEALMQLFSHFEMLVYIWNELFGDSISPFLLNTAKLLTFVNSCTYIKVSRNSGAKIACEANGSTFFVNTWVLCESGRRIIYWPLIVCERWGCILFICILLVLCVDCAALSSVIRDLKISPSSSVNPGGSLYNSQSVQWGLGVFDHYDPYYEYENRENDSGFALLSDPYVICLFLFQKRVVVPYYWVLWENLYLLFKFYDIFLVASFIPFELCGW